MTLPNRPFPGLLYARSRGFAANSTWQTTLPIELYPHSIPTTQSLRLPPTLLPTQVSQPQTPFILLFRLYRQTPPRPNEHLKSHNPNLIIPLPLRYQTETLVGVVGRALRSPDNLFGKTNWKRVEKNPKPQKVLQGSYRLQRAGQSVQQREEGFQIPVCGLAKQCLLHRLMVTLLNQMAPLRR